MRWRFTLQVVGIVVCFVGMAMLVPLGASLYFQGSMINPFLESISLTLSCGLVLFFLFRSTEVETITHREGMAIVTLGWASAGFFGSLPFLLSGYVPVFTDCVFETFSGFTTTGATIFDNVEILPKSLLLWRSLTQWLGGMGIILLSLAILPFLGVGGMQLYKAEVPGPTPDKLRPRVKDTALLLWKVYLLFTALEIILLFLGGMDFFSSVCHTFDTMPTGGFSTKNASIGHYSSLYFDIVITVFMFIAGTNFAIHFKLLRGDFRSFWRDPEFRFYLGAIVVFTLVICITLWGSVYVSLGQSLRFSLFQVVSIVTTTGYATADYELWGALPQVLLFLCMFLGGCAGSTGGGIKGMRILVLIKHVKSEMVRAIHPNAIIPVKFGGRVVPAEVLNGIWGFFLLYCGLTCIATIVLAAVKVDILTSFAAVIACMSNVGPGLGLVGPTDNYAHIPKLGKWVLSFCMLLGRLEIYTVIVLFTPVFWKK